MKKCLNQISWLQRLLCTAHTIQLVVGKGAITDVETCWSSTFIAWERLIILKPYIDIVISSLNVSKDRNAKDDAKRLMKINLTDDEWNTIRDLLEILGSFAELIEKLKGTKYATMNYIYPEVDEDDEPEVRQKIKINTPVNISGLLNNIKVNLYKALEKYYEIIEKEALFAILLDPRKKKIKFADENEKEFAKNSLYEVYELAKNDTNIQQESHKPKLKKRKLSKGYVYKESLFSDDKYDDTQTKDNETEKYLVIAVGYK
ncbi:zinc finger BED domain-containing protein 1-like [Rhizophagus clarus]|uniref:Zinc finger BED domain-containing protein 1-like n=1 Tax=Rhizophagus clarus TaxID=94130 RepID=A0A8H3KT47_9GLOM|nr:zinc finger BED domain-containing protein 1-like [Rhizophagus clarus]